MSVDFLKNQLSCKNWIFVRIIIQKKQFFLHIIFGRPSRPVPQYCPPILKFIEKNILFIQSCKRADKYKPELENISSNPKNDLKTKPDPQKPRN